MAREYSPNGERGGVNAEVWGGVWREGEILRRNWLGLVEGRRESLEVWRAE